MIWGVTVLGRIVAAVGGAYKKGVLLGHPGAVSPKDIATADLSKFPAIVLGVRAYAVRDDLRAYNKRLLDYVSNGGTLVVQDERADGYVERGVTRGVEVPDRPAVHAPRSVLQSCQDPHGRDLRRPGRGPRRTGAGARGAPRPAQQPAGRRGRCLQLLAEPGVPREDGGLGLGLSICYQIAEEHGGTIRVDTAGERGACFVLELPAAARGSETEA